MNANATHTATAAKLLNAARDMHDRREVVSHEVPGYGAAHVTYMPASRTYDVGTAARSHATGKRSAVLPALVAILAHRFEFLGRGLLPLGNFFSALPLVGVAPIMVMWFGFDWQSKAAVVVVMTFFPMLVNAAAGLTGAGAMERDLMKTYAASYEQTLFKLRLPAALPFVFNALKINATLAMIGAIVAEFFGTPTVGMGFRISTEVGHLSIDMVWATIVVAAVSGSLFYALIALAERRATFWHASYRAR